MELTGIVAIISTFGFIPLLVYLVHRHKQRLKLIEKGTFVDSLSLNKKENKMETLKIAMLMIGLGLGVLIAYALVVFTPMQEEVAYFSCILLFGGFSLFLYYLLLTKNK